MFKEQEELILNNNSNAISDTEVHLHRFIQKMKDSNAILNALHKDTDNLNVSVEA